MKQTLVSPRENKELFEKFGFYTSEVNGDCIGLCHDSYRLKSEVYIYWDEEYEPEVYRIDMMYDEDAEWVVSSVEEVLEILESISNNLDQYEQFIDEEE
jgi:hypothetical protein